MDTLPRPDFVFQVVEHGTMNLAHMASYFQFKYFQLYSEVQPFALPCLRSKRCPYCR